MLGDMNGASMGTSTRAVILAWCGVALLDAGPGFGGESVVRSGPRPLLAGVWRLNAAASEDGREKLLDSLAPARSQPGVNAPIGVPGPRGGFALPTGRPGVDPEELRDAVDQAVQAPLLLTIEQTETEIDLTSDDGAMRVLRPDGRKIKRDGSKAVAQVRWDAAGLVEEQRLGDLTVVTLYALGNGEARQLIVTVTLSAAGEPLTLRRVYDAEP
jgi:hypothetical protein